MTPPPQPFPARTHEPFTEGQKTEIKRLVGEAIKEYFEDKGKFGKNVLITTATIIGSLIVILGGIKTFLAWLGFNYMK